MGRRQIVLVSTAVFSVLNTGIFWREAKTKRLFSQCRGDGVQVLRQINTLRKVPLQVNFLDDDILH
jgi:hypothetical protein